MYYGLVTETKGMQNINFSSRPWPIIYISAHHSEPFVECYILNTARAQFPCVAHGQISYPDMVM